MKIDLSKNYISMIKNSIGTKMFRNNFFELNNKNIDILKDGELSCAYFVSGILKIFGLIKNIHCTVEGTIKDMEKLGRKEYKGENIQNGSILLWEEKKGHKHIGFYVGNDWAISNCSKKRMIAKHNFEYNKKRKIEKVFVNSKLDLRF